MVDMEYFEHLANKAIDADLKAQEMLRQQEQESLSTASAQTSQEPDGVSPPSNGERHIYRVQYYSIPQIIHREYVKLGSMWCPKKKVKRVWEGNWKKHTKIIVARNEEQAKSMLHDGAEADRGPEFRFQSRHFVNQFDRRSFIQVIVEVTKWEVVI